MKQFIEERVEANRLLADKADRFTKVRLLKWPKDTTIGRSGVKAYAPAQRTDRSSFEKHRLTRR